MKFLTQQDIENIISLHQSGKYQEVIKRSKSLLKDLPNEIFLWNILGASHEQLNNLVEAQSSYERAVEINNQVPEILFNLGAIKFNLNDIEGALKNYDKALNLKSDFVEVFFNKGILFQHLGKFEEALVEYQKAINLQPGFYEVLNNIGSVYQQIGDLEKAIQVYEKSLTISSNARTHFNLAGALRNKGLLKASIAEYEKAISMEPKNPEFFSDIGDALWHDGEVAKARQFLEKAVEIDPLHEKANYQLAIFYYDNHLLKEAIPHFKKAKLYDSESRALYCLYKLEEFKEFEKYLKKAIGKIHSSPLLSTLSLHYSKNFNKPNMYNFCPNPLDFVMHVEVPELKINNGQLIHELLSDINAAEISDRQQSRLINGIQSSGNLFQRKEQSFLKLSEALKILIKNFYEFHKNNNCDFVKLFPKNISFSSSWFVRMKSGGHLKSHIHEDGWISGAVYLKIPKIRNNNEEGAIELSTDGDGYPKQHNNFPVKTILPNEGDVIFFPSSVFHRTIPFSSNEERICIAFDLKPT
jgi:uncharacterized protein (TIGR02466 family)